MNKILITCLHAFAFYYSYAQSCLPDSFFDFDHVFEDQMQIDNFFVNHEGCDTIEGNIQIARPYHCCDGIVNLDAFKNITTINGNLSILESNDLINLTGFEKLSSIGGDLILRLNRKLTSLEGLENLKSVGGNIIVKYNKALSNLNGLENVQSVQGLSVIGNDTLTDIQSLKNVDSLDNVAISKNRNLAICSLPNVCDFLFRTKIPPTISENADGCNFRPPSPTQLSCYGFEDHLQVGMGIDGFGIIHY